MTVIGLFDINLYGITKGKEYEVIYEYDTVYELKCDDGKIYCRPKSFYTIKEDEDED